MRWVPQATSQPHRCAAIPFLGNSNARRGFIDTGQILHGYDPYVYLSVEAVEEMARMIGWQPGHVQAGHKQTVADLHRRLKESAAEVDALRSRLDAVKVLKNGGFAQANPPGRPPRKVAA